MDIFVGRLMSSPVQTVTRSTPIQEAADLMLRHGIGSVVVVDDVGHLDGILTATDFVTLAADGQPAEETEVNEYMTTDVVTTTANDSVYEVAQTMLDHGFHHVPVVDDTEGVVGIITTTDFTAYLSETGASDAA
ncbi:CBS domain-containing protein [Halogranum rubrum]|uniref:Signal-transduction protein containing camp-binding and cbs domain protein n=1 Tax=Halogranum salarium B-1 TaxID=1210908 RepID=J3EVH4_9EURY|nr:CBS domain-containing protein [Halogranum salarium]EJN58622.1 signal-transduction protein containing camp-binding and cbs domain protein [Halogranum salarium B-1]